MDERRSQYIVGGVVAAVVIVVIVLAVTKTSDPVCELQAAQPKIDSNKTKTIISAENNALLKFAGYVKYELDPKSGGQNTFLDLNGARSVVLKTGSNLVIEADCATITINLDLNYGGDQVKISSVTMELVKPNGQYNACSMSFGVVYPKGKHYSCTIEKSYPCGIDTKTKDKNNKEIIIPVATLTVTNLEFEINGSADKVKAGEFSTGPAECSKITNLE